MKIVLELSPNDLRYFRKCLQAVREGEGASNEELVLSSAAELIEEVEATETPEFVRDRMQKLRMLIDMLEDEQWRLVGRDRARVLNALAYFVDPDDLIPDRIPGIGYLDDAIMVELVVQELAPEIEAYEKFCEFREVKPDDGALAKQRVSLQTRMRRRRRRQREARRNQTGKKSRSPLSLF